MAVGAAQVKVALPVAICVTVTLKAVRAVESWPSETDRVMPAAVPTLPAAGVPLSSPVLAFRVNHAGLFITLNVSASPSESDAVGLKS